MTEEALAVIVRLCNRKQLLAVFPKGGDPWCEARHSSFPSSTDSRGYRWCTRQKSHDEPHIDYDLSGETLIWLDGSDKLHRLNEGDDE